MWNPLSPVKLLTISAVILRENKIEKDFLKKALPTEKYDWANV